MKRRSKILFGFIGFVALITVVKYIDNRVVNKLDQDIRMSGAGIEERLAELDLDQLEDERGNHHCKRVRIYGLYQYQTCFVDAHIPSELPRHQTMAYRYTPPRPFLSFGRLLISNTSYFHGGTPFQGDLGRIFNDGSWDITVRTSRLESYRNIDPSDYQKTSPGSTTKIVKKGTFK